MNVMRYLMVPIVALLLAACGDDASRSERMVGQAKPDASGTAGVGPDASRAGTIKISFVMKSLANPFFVEMARGARQAQREQGIVLQVQASSPETSVEQQIRMVESQIGAGVKAIVISPVDTRRLVPVLKRAQDAGIRIVNVDERIQPEALAQHGMKQVPFIGVDSQLGAYQAAKFLADKLVKPTEAAVIEGIPGTNTSIDRRKGIEKAFAENSKIRIVARGLPTGRRRRPTSWRAGCSRPIPGSARCIAPMTRWPSA